MLVSECQWHLCNNSWQQPIFPTPITTMSQRKLVATIPETQEAFFFENSKKKKTNLFVGLPIPKYIFNLSLDLQHTHTHTHTYIYIYSFDTFFDRLRVRWRSRDELISDVLQWTPSHGRAKAGRPARTYLQQLCADIGCNPEDLPKAMDNREGWQESVWDIRVDSVTWLLYIYIYIIQIQGLSKTYQNSIHQ